jgi:hypothetical protein
MSPAGIQNTNSIACGDSIFPPLDGGVASFWQRGQPRSGGGILFPPPLVGGGEGKWWLNRLRQFLPSVVPAWFWRGPSCLCRLRRPVFIAGPAPRAGYFLLLAQEKVTKEKDTPEPPKIPALLAPAGRSPSAERRASGSTPARDLPRPWLRCSAAATGPNVKTGSCRVG